MLNLWNGPGGPWAPGNENIGSAFDFWMLGRHYSGYYVGLNAIPSAATIIFGVMAGELILRSTDSKRTSRALFIFKGFISEWRLDKGPGFRVLLTRSRSFQSTT